MFYTSQIKQQILSFVFMVSYQISEDTHDKQTFKIFYKLQFCLSSDFD